MTGQVNLTKGSSPGTPSSGYARIYIDSSGNLHIINDTGVDTTIAAAALSALTDVSLGTLANGDVLTYTGSAWTNVASSSGSTNNITQDIAFSGDISPTSISASQDNYNPTGLSTASTLRLTSSAAYNITGLAGGSDGRLMLVHNVGSNNITLKDESASSTAANRFALNADVVLGADQAALLQYDSTSARWRTLAYPSSSAMTLIGDTELSGSTASITFSSIPATYKHLVLYFSLRSDVVATTDELRVRLNGDTGSNYDSFGYTVNSAGLIGHGDDLGTTYWRHQSSIAGASAGSGLFGNGIMRFVDYTEATNYHTFGSDTDLKIGTGAGNLYRITKMGAFRSAGAISTILLYPGAGTNFVAGSRATLYGVS